MRSRTDSEILAWIDSVGGTDAFLDLAFTGLCDAFVADRAGGRSAIVDWRIRTPDRGVVTYQVVVSDGACHAERGSSRAPEIALDIAMVDFSRLLLGGLDSGEAVDSGRLGVSGNRELATAIRDWFQRSN